MLGGRVEELGGEGEELGDDLYDGRQGRVIAYRAKLLDESGLREARMYGE